MEALEQADLDAARDAPTEVPDGARYRRFPPLPQLRGLVAEVWIQEDSRDYGTSWTPTVVLPTGASELILYHGDPFVRVDGDRLELLPRLSFGGQRTRAIRVTATGRTGIVIVLFEPWGASRFFGPSLASVRDENLDVSVLVGRRWGTRLRDSLLRATDLETAAQALQHFLVSCLRAAPSPLAERVARTIRRARGNVDVELLASSLRVSRRQLHRSFTAVVGLSPKRFADLVRFQEAVACRARGMPWAEVAAACGFYDQAHLVHRWRDVTGEAPGVLPPDRPATPLRAFFNDPPTSQIAKTAYL